MGNAPVAADRWCGVTIDEWRARWDVPRLYIFHQVGSTNDEARRLAEAGAPAGTVVLADVQTRGRGRRGRTWTAAPGSALLLSMVLRPRHGAVDSVLSLRLGLAVAIAIEAVVPATVGIKWPNDLEIDGRKVAGILCEAALEGGRLAFAVAGVGINIRRSDDEWSAEVRERATSLEAVAAAPPDPERLAAALIPRLSSAGSQPSPALTASEREELARRDSLRGQLISVDGRPAGRAAGIARHGALLVHDGTGERTVLGGTVRILTPEEIDGP